jgi:hypothetical protein
MRRPVLCPRRLKPVTSLASHLRSIGSLQLFAKLADWPRSDTAWISAY